MATAVSPEASIRNGLAPIRALPVFCGDVAVKTTPGFLVALRAVQNRDVIWRFTITNTSAVETLGVVVLDGYVASTDHFPSLISGYKKILPQQTWEVQFSTNLAVGCIGTNTLTASVYVDEQV